MNEEETTAKLDAQDKVILRILQDNSNTSLKEIAAETGLSSSTIHYRINRLIKEKVIMGFTAQVDPMKVGKDILAISLVNGKYGTDHSKKLGEKLAQIEGVWAVYYLLGSIDFALLVRASSREELKEILEAIMNIPDVEKSNTYLVLERIKEDPKVRI